jgi:hypothetical protein
VKIFTNTLKIDLSLFKKKRKSLSLLKIPLKKKMSLDSQSTSSSASTSEVPTSSKRGGKKAKSVASSTASDDSTVVQKKEKKTRVVKPKVAKKVKGKKISTDENGAEQPASEGRKAGRGNIAKRLLYKKFVQMQIHANGLTAPKPVMNHLETFFRSVLDVVLHDSKVNTSFRNKKTMKEVDVKRAVNDLISGSNMDKRLSSYSSK